ncbi:MAG: methionine aminopeptidase [Chlamydiae bacterium SM23_39]|nr:MAG: methionine aminopeptidase [Chlamydiae bacterium SM23_39]
MSRNDPCWCGSGKKWKKCHFPQISFDQLKKEYLEKYQIILKTVEEIKKIKHSCKIASKILNILCTYAKEGVTTNELDILSKKLHKEENAIPAPLGYGNPPFPKSICTSLNEVICHGIPNDEPLQKGDILNVDVTSIVEGYYGDCSRMVKIGEVSEEKNRVIEASYECLMRAIEICKPDSKIYEIGNVIEEYAKKYRCSVVDQFVGHGIGLYFHEPPQIPHHYNNVDIPMTPGMVFTIEPMINIGVKEAVISKEDGWTARTKDLKPSAQWEHTILITDKGHEVLTL